MNSWEAAGNKVSRRSFAELADGLDVIPPFSFSFQDAISEVPDFLSDAIRERGAPCQSAVEFPGRDVALARDVFTCASKFLHVLQCCRAHALRGAVTWAVVDSYHAAFLGMRTLCGLLGVVPYAVDDRTIIVDFRPELGSPQDIHRFRSDFGRLTSPIRILAPTPKQMEQRHFWMLAGRLLRLARAASDADADTLDALEAAAKSSPGAFRNEVLYSPLAWRWRDDTAFLACSALAGSPYVLSKLNEADKEMGLLNEVYNLAQKYIRQWCGRVGLSIEALPPGTSLVGSPHILVA